MKNKQKPILIGISGVKNSGKTTLIIKLIPRLVSLGYKVATIKHDGHDFKGDIEGTDSYRHKEAGAYGTAIFSKTKFMLVKEQTEISEKDLVDYFPEADIILLEGFKYCNYPKIEVIRKSVSESYVCKKDTIIALATDLEYKFDGIKSININNIDEIVNVLEIYIKEVTYV